MDKKSAKRLAVVQTTDQRRLDMLSGRAVSRPSAQLHKGLIRSYRRGESTLKVVSDFEVAFTEIVTKAMLAAHLRGHIRVVLRSSKRVTHRKLFATPYDESLAFMQKRLRMKPEQVQALTEKYGEASLKVTSGLGDVVEKKAKESVEGIVSRGEHVRQGVVTLSDDLAKTGVTPAKPWLMEAIVRTQIQIAYAAGRWNALQDAAVQEILWGYQYVTVGDDRVRPNHALLDGTRAPKEDPMWSKIWPPNGINCRCQTIELFDEQDPEIPPAMVMVEGIGVIPGPDVGWSGNSGEVYADMIQPVT